MHKFFLETALLPDGWHDGVTATVEHGRFIAVETGAARPADATPVAGIALPGIPNLHSHTFQRGFAGLTERRGAADDHFWTWREEMYRFLRALTPEDVEAIAAQSFVEMLEGGFTAVAEFHYLHHQPDGRPFADPAELAGRIAAAAQTSGIGLTLLPVFYAHGGFGDRPPTPGQTRFICDIDGFQRLAEASRQLLAPLPEAGFGIAPHSLRAVSGGELAHLLAAFRTGPVHIHAAEQVLEVEDCVAATGARPVEWLLANAALDSRWCLIHATHMSEDETRRLAASTAVAGLCPITESNLGDGIFPAVDYLGAGGRFGVGTDSNVLISAPSELRTLEYSQRLRDRARNRLGRPDISTGRRLFEEAARGGAQALGRASGAIAAGQVADLVVLDRADVQLHGRAADAVLDAWLFASTRPLIDAVYVAGRQVVSGGRHIARDAVATSFRAALDRIAATV